MRVESAVPFASYHDWLAFHETRHRPVLTTRIHVYTLNCMYRTFDLSETRECHCLAARRMARELTRLYEGRLRPHGLRATQFSVLAALSQKGPSTISELADALGLERTTLSRGAALLERNAWIGSTQSDLDARERVLSLTPAGLAKLEQAFPDWKAAQEMVEQGSFQRFRHP